MRKTRERETQRIIARERGEREGGKEKEREGEWEKENEAPMSDGWMSDINGWSLGPEMDHCVDQ